MFLMCFGRTLKIWGPFVAKLSSIKVLTYVGAVVFIGERMQVRPVLGFSRALMGMFRLGTKPSKIFEMYIAM